MRVLDLQNFLSDFTSRNKTGTAQGNAISNAVIYIEINGQLREISNMEVHEHTGPIVIGNSRPTHRLVLKTQKPRIPIFTPKKLVRHEV